MKNKKYITDNILGLITFDHQIFIDLFETFELKRLGRINHLGMTSFLYPTATHTRLSHSLGVYEIARRLLQYLEPEISEQTSISIKVAALLHDLGHGIYSHVFESVSVFPHEKYSIKLIESPLTDVNKVLKKYSPTLVQEVVSLLEGKHKLKWANQVISSEIDVDRLDYLQRDSIMTGTNYGKLELEWILRNAKIVEGKLVFDIKALSSLEKMIVARFHMNQSVYNNPKNVSNSQLFTFYIERLKYLLKNNMLKENYDRLLPVLEEKEMTEVEFLLLDDYVFHNYLLNSLHENDTILKELSRRIMQQIPADFVLGEETLNLKNTFDQNLENQTWTIKNLKFDFVEYQSTRKKEAKILINGEIKNIREISTLVTNKKINKDIKKKKIGIFIKYEK